MRTCVLLVIVTLLMSVSARGGIAIDPAEPHHGDRVSITISHWVGSTAYSIKSVSMEKQDEFILFDVVWDVGSLGCDMITLRECTRSAGFLRPGTYTVEVNHQGALTGSESAEFTVLPRRDESTSLQDLRQRLRGIPTGFDSLYERWSDFFAGRPFPSFGHDGLTLH